MKQNWEIKKLGDVAKIGAGNSAPQDKSLFIDGIYPFFRTSDAGKVRIGELNNAVDLLNDEGIKKLKLYPKGTILLPKSGASTFLNHRVILGVDGFVSSHLATIISDNEHIENSFLLYYLMGVQAQDLIQDHSYPSLKLSDINEISISIPPLDEQKRIVAKLDQCFEAIDKARTNVEKNLNNAKELFQSKLNEIFIQKGEDWVEKKLGDVASLKGRIGWKGLTAKEYTEEGALFLSVHSLNYGDYVDFRDANHISDERYEESPEIMLKEGDILICKDGAGIGKVGIVGKLDERATVNSSLLVIRGGSHISTEYLYFSLLSSYFQNIVKKRLQGATTPHLYQRDITTFPIYLPTIDEQNSIIKKIDKINNYCQNLEINYQQELDALDELKKSILQKAFNGEL
jgi:type I restriction enzyme, S subunit